MKKTCCCGNVHRRATEEKCLKCKPRTYTQEQRTSISNGRKRFLANNPDKHPWKRSSKHVSVPCEVLKAKLRSKNISFVEEFRPLSSRAFSIDIAFPNEKIGIEVNGFQHYDSTGKLNPYYQQRHDEIVASGWFIHELPYYMAWDDNIVEQLSLPSSSDYSDMIADRIAKQQNKKPLQRGKKLQLKTEQRWADYRDQVRNSGINFSKQGWVKEVSGILGISPQKISLWMKKYLPDVYALAFKRKINIHEETNS